MHLHLVSLFDLKWMFLSCLSKVNFLGAAEGTRNCSSASAGEGRDVFGTATLCDTCKLCNPVPQFPCLGSL